MLNHVTEYGCGRSHWHEHSPEELEAAWNDVSGQGNSQARAKGWACVTVTCNKEQALELSAMFHRHFAIESCCYWDGGVLSMYCGDAGGSYRDLMATVFKSTKELGFSPHTEDGKEPRK